MLAISVRDVVGVIADGAPSTLGEPPARTRLVRRLDDAVRGVPLVLVTGPAGAGKSALVSAWLHRVGDDASAHTVDLRHGAHEGLEAADPSRITVLENLPSAPAAGDATDALVRAGAAGGRVVGVCTGYPVLDLRRLGSGIQHRTIGGRDLTMNDLEIASALQRHGVECTRTTVRAVAGRTFGWAAGVELAATLLSELDEADALEELDRSLADYLEASLLDGLPDRVRDLLTVTSVVEHVTPESSSAIAGAGRRLSVDDVTGLRGFARRRGDGSFTLHPLLRRHLRRDLQRTRSATAVARRAARFEVERGRADEAIAIAVEAADWAGAAGIVIDSLQVTRLLTATTDELLTRAQVVDALGAVEPVLMAAVAVSRGWPDLARRAVDRSARRSDRSPSGLPSELSQALVRMALARWEGDPVSGRLQLRRAQALVSRLSVSRRVAVPELGPLIQSHLAAFELCDGTPERARAALEQGARAFRPRPDPAISPPTQAVAADCLGMLAWQEALAGELTSALHHSAGVLTARAADSSEIGVVHAQLATVWCHLERGEIDQAGQRLDGVRARRAIASDAAVLPELDDLIVLVTAGLEMALGRHWVEGAEDRSTVRPRRVDDQLLLLRVRGLLDLGDVEAAHRLLDQLAVPSTESQLLRGRAAAQQGDVAAVGESLRTRPIARPTLVSQIQVELLEGWLARSHHDPGRQRCVLDRALCSAEREQLRAPIAWAKPWLRDVISSDPLLLRRHGAFLATIQTVLLAPPAPMEVGSTSPSAELSRRELDILQRLGSLSTNEEIAAELFLSTNTVKTHLKSLYRKLDVTRRSDAFRRGRLLGLC